MDLTLYSNPEYGQQQIDCLIEEMAKFRFLSFAEMDSEIKNAREEWALSHDGVKPSLSNIITAYGISMEQNIRWREERYEPEKYIKEDAQLRTTLKELSLSYILGLVTNNPVLIANRTLKALGVGECFPIVVGLDTCMVAKPHKKPFLMFSQLSSCAPETCVSIGDRFDIDLLLPMELGMGAILVNGVEDVYNLPGFLLS